MTEPQRGRADLDESGASASAASAASLAGLPAVLEEARTRGLLGASVSIEEQIDHALAFADAAGNAPAHGVDLGSGGGLPGLVLAQSWASSSWLLVDAQQRRTDFLLWAVNELDVGDRVEVRHGRAEDVARDPLWRARCELVVARSFGPPSVVAECAAGFLQIGGRLVVSEPPAPDLRRWDTEAAKAGVAALGLESLTSPTATAFRFKVLVQVEGCPDRYPRRVGIPAKRPLF